MDRNMYRRWLLGLLAIALTLTLGYSRYEAEMQTADIAVSAAQAQRVYPCGKAVGIYLQTNGVLVVGTGKVTDETGETKDPASGLVESGDYIEKVNGQEIHSKTELVNVIREQGTDPVALTLRREETTEEVSVTPVKGSEGVYMLGIWVRDDTQGIGTLSYVTESGDFGALGHGISDTDTGMIVETLKGSLYPAVVTDVVKGTGENPGSMCGSIFYDEAYAMGTITGNSVCGIFGKLSLDPAEAWGVTAIPVGSPEDVSPGRALIRSDISGVLRDYEIEILKISPNSNANKNIVLKVTDPELIALTGGIVQGMSGSPIIQNGKMVGAVTHVLVNDPTRGYGIFAETMMEQ